MILIFFMFCCHFFITGAITQIAGTVPPFTPHPHLCPKQFRLQTYPNPNTCASGFFQVRKKPDFSQNLFFWVLGVCAPCAVCAGWANCFSKCSN